MSTLNQSTISYKELHKHSKSKTYKLQKSDKTEVEMSNTPNFTLINLTACLSMAKSCYTTRFYIPNLQTHFKKPNSEKYNPSFFIHTLDDDLYITVRGSMETPDFETFYECQELKTKYGVFLSGYYKSAINTYARSLSYIKSNKYKRIFVVGHSYGAAVSQIMCVLIKSDFPDKDVYAVGFGPVVCMDTATSDKFKDRIISIINHNDLVPSVSVRNVGEFLKRKFPGVDITKREAIKAIKDQMASIETEGIPAGAAIRDSLSNIVKMYGIRSLKNNSERMYHIKYVAGFVYQIGQEGKTKMSESLIDPAQQYNALATDPKCVFYHTPNPYVKTLNEMIID